MVIAMQKGGRRTGTVTSQTRASKNTERADDIWYQHVILGIPQRRLSEEYGISYGRVSQIIAEQRKLQPESTRQERAADLVAQLVEDMAHARALWRAGDRANGRMYIRLMESYRRVLGLDAPVRLSVGQEGPATYVIEGDPEVLRALTSPDVALTCYTDENGVTHAQYIPQREDTG